MNLLRSGDVELNPGLLQDIDNQTRLPLDSLSLLNFQLGQLGLIALDVCFAGDCFFRAISHQFFGNSNHPFYIRQAADFQILSNMTKHNQTAPNKWPNGNVWSPNNVSWCLHGRQTFPIWTGLKKSLVGLESDLKLGLLP